MKKILFVGEERSPTAIRMNVTWKDKRLCAGHLSKATDELGMVWDDLNFKNVFEDNIQDIKSFKGIGKVEKELKKHQIEHEFIYHPATRGAVRKTENYIAHVREQLQHIMPM